MPESTDLPLFLQLLIWFGVLMSAGFGNPIPEELMLVGAGIHASQMLEYGVWRWLMFPAVLAGAIMADLLLYGLGYFLGGKLMQSKLMLRLAPTAKQERIRENFDRYGVLIFVIGRLVPGIRTTLFLTAGAMRLNIFRFLIADGTGAIFGTSIFFFLGYGLGSQFKNLVMHIEEEINPYKPILLLTLLAIIAGYLTFVFFRHPIPTGDPEEVPLFGHQIAAHMPMKEGEERITSGPSSAGIRPAVSGSERGEESARSP